MNPEDRDLLAAELALGLLSGEDRFAAERLRDADAGFAGEVAAWEARFADFYLEIAEVAPDPVVWRRIMERLATDAPVRPAANDDRPVRGSGALPWKISTGLFGAMAAGLAVVLIVRPEPPAPPAPVVVQAPAETLVAQLNASDGSSMLAARLDTQQRQLRVRATAIPAGAGEPELWVIPAGGAPRSLGLVARDGETLVALVGDLDRLVADGATLALTLEPREGAPHAAPTGDILGAARITRL
jgi:anti-sigma-K factor RskA